MMEKPPALRSVGVGQWLNDRGQWEERQITIPANFPAERLALLKRATWWVDPAMFRWLLRLPVYGSEYLVALSPHNTIHRIGKTGNGFDCGNAAALFGMNSGIRYVLLEEALAVVIDAKTGQRIQPYPCRTCFSTGLLMAKSQG